MSVTDTLRDRLKSMAPGNEMVVVPPAFEVLLFGAKGATITKKGMATVTFSDGATKSKALPCSLLDSICDEVTMCQLVGAVQ